MRTIDADALINAIRQKWNDEHPVYEDTSGSMTYSEIIDFISSFAKVHNVLKVDRGGKHEAN